MSERGFQSKKMTKKIFVVQDGWAPRHDAQGVKALCLTQKEASALKAELDGTWDGCEGHFNIKTFSVEIGLQAFIKRGFFCLHDWEEKRAIFRCKKCSAGWNKENKNPPPKFNGIAYWDEEKKELVFPTFKLIYPMRIKWVMKSGKRKQKTFKSSHEALDWYEDDRDYLRSWNVKKRTLYVKVEGKWQRQLCQVSTRAIKEWCRAEVK